MKSIPAILRRLLRWTALGLAVGCASCALAGQFGRWSNWLDVFNHFAPLWLAGGAFAMAIWFALHRTGRLIPLAAALAMLASGERVAPELLARNPGVKEVRGAETLKIIQFNVSNQNVDEKATLRWLLAQDADIIVVEEVEGTPNIHHGLWNKYHFRRTCSGYSYCEAMIFSKRKPFASGGLMQDVGFPVVWAAYYGAGGPYVVFSTHTSWPIPAGMQQWQSRNLSQIMASFPQRRLILAGDFNSTPWSFSLARQDRRLGLERRTRAIASWPAAPYKVLNVDPLFPILPIDHVYAGQGWGTVSLNRGPRLGSDHYPIMITLQAR